ncbi:MAG TPA: murein biosynthesis integral membrane protein MurJ [Actinomycetota bacterium]|nr:murein biosynthesis integral membrane protein MurJ [Actinomycetota bacterium]
MTSTHDGGAARAADKASPSLGRATAYMTLGTVLSRVTGLLRIAAILAALGILETGLADPYNYANTAPNIIYELVLGGILTSVFVPVFVELLEKEGREGAWAVASAILNVALAVLLAITVVGIVAAPWIASFYGGDGTGERAAAQHDVLTFLLRLFIPQVIFYGLAAITAGLLNAHKRFGAPMYTPVLNNLAVIAVFVAFRAAYGGGVTATTVTDAQLWILGLGTTAGVALMAVAQIPFLRGLGRYRVTFSLRHPALRKLARLSVFVVGYVVANQIGYLVVQRLASYDEGAYSAYVNAFTFFMLPHGLFAVSVFTALLPGLSEHAVNERWTEFRERLSVGVRATALLVVPAAVGYLVLGEAIVRVIAERGVMTHRSTELVAAVLRLFVLGLPAFSLFQLFLRAFYALQDTRTPFLVNCAAVALNTAVNVPMFVWLGVEGLAAGHALAYVFGATLLARALSRRVGGLDGRRVAVAVARIGAAAAGMGAVVWALWRVLSDALGTSLVAQTLVVGVPVVAGVAVYLGLAVALRVEELGYVRSLLTRRLRGASGGAAPRR